MRGDCTGRRDKYRAVERVINSGGDHGSDDRTKDNNPLGPNRKFLVDTLSTPPKPGRYNGWIDEVAGMLFPHLHISRTKQLPAMAVADSSVSFGYCYVDAELWTIQGNLPLVTKCITLYRAFEGERKGRGLGG